MEYAITRGSLQMLADKPRIGWHPRFEEILGIGPAGKETP